MPLYRPRMLAMLTVPVLGTREQRIRQAKSTDVVRLEVRPRQARIDRQDHNQADTLELDIDWMESGIDPRLLDDTEVEFYLANADEFGSWGPGETELRFLGHARNVSNEMAEGAPPAVHMTCVDYTSLFIMAKPFGSSGTPLYSDTLEDAWRRVVSQTPGAEVLKDRLLFLGDVDKSAQIGKAVPERFRKAGKVHTKPDSDAWSVWQHCVGMLGLVSWIDLDACIVSTATDLYTGQTTTPKLVWGRNIKSWEESRSGYLAHKGIALTSFNPETSQVIESFFPPIGDPRAKKKRIAAKKAKSEAAALQGEDREYLQVPGISDQAWLDTMAERIWEERSRQELTGRCTTAEMKVSTMQLGEFDLLNLKAGDSIEVSIDPADRNRLVKLGSTQERINYLTRRGYSSDAAELIAKNAEIIAGLPSVFMVKSCQIVFDVSRDDGTFEISIEYINRIQLDGSAYEATT